MSYGLFEHLAATADDDKKSSRTAVAVAHKRAQDKFGEFLSVATSDEDYQDRLDLVREDLSQSVREAAEEHGGDPIKIEASVLRNLKVFSGPFPTHPDSVYKDEAKTFPCKNCGTDIPKFMGGGKGDLLCPGCDTQHNGRGMALAPREKPDDGRTADIEGPHDPDRYGSASEEQTIEDDHNEGKHSDYPNDRCPLCGDPTDSHEAKTAAESINLEPDWEGMRRWVLNVAQTDPQQAAKINAAMGSEGVDPQEFDHMIHDGPLPGDQTPSSQRGQEGPGGHLGSVRESRKPKLCPYHSEVVDISLSSADPRAGYEAMSSHAWGDNHCQGNTFDGRCNFKRDMVTQSYWDAKTEKAEERKRERQERLEQEQQVTAEPAVNDFADEAPVDSVDPVDEGSELIDSLGEAPSAVGEGMGGGAEEGMEMAIAGTNATVRTAANKLSVTVPFSASGDIDIPLSDLIKKNIPDMSIGKLPKIPVTSPGFAMAGGVKEALTAKDFRLIAEAVRSAPNQDPTSPELAHHFADHLEATNPMFDRDRFVGAATGQPVTQRDVHKASDHGEGVGGLTGLDDEDDRIEEECPECHGNTKMFDRNGGHCERCDGAGKIYKQAEALKTVDLPAANAEGHSDDPSPKMDKSEWKNLKPIDTEMDGSPHPTETIDILDPIPADRKDNFLDGTDAVTEHQDVTKKVDTPKPIKDNNDWSSNNGTSPVSSATVDVHKNPIRDILEDDFVPQSVVDEAVQNHQPK